MSRRTNTPDIPPPIRLRTGIFRRVAIILIGLALAPIVYEVVVSSAARWSSLYGPYTHAETPILDATARGFREVRHVLARFVHDQLHDLPWHTTVVMVVGGVAFIFGYWILRRA